MYKYIICKFFSEKYFVLQCNALERHIPDLVESRYLGDVDGSAFKEYIHDKGKIKVINDYPVGAMWIESDFGITPYFE